MNRVEVKSNCSQLTRVLELSEKSHESIFTPQFLQFLKMKIDFFTCDFSKICIFFNSVPALDQIFSFF